MVHLGPRPLFLEIAENNRNIDRLTEKYKKKFFKITLAKSKTHFMDPISILIMIKSNFSKLLKTLKAILLLAILIQHNLHMLPF